MGKIQSSYDSDSILDGMPNDQISFYCFNPVRIFSRTYSKSSRTSAKHQNLPRCTRQGFFYKWPIQYALQDIQLSNIQKRIIRHDKGHLRIVACPGSGKTEVVSRRIAELIKKGVEPSKIVAFTFTKKAAEELKLRIRRILKNTQGKSDFGEMYIGTIDSFCLHIIRKVRPEFQVFEILDSAKRMAFIDRWYYDMGFDVMQGMRTGKWRVMQAFCTSADRAMTEEIDISMIRTDGFAECYDRYVKKLEEKKFFDFTSVIFKLTGC